MTHQTIMSGQFAKNSDSSDNVKLKRESCAYMHENGNYCTLDKDESGFCFWHNKDADKTGDDIKERFTEVVKQGIPVAGFKLQRSNLANINLVKYGSKTGYNLSGVDFYRANLRGAHLFLANLSDASLMKADLRESNLHYANLSNCNLLGVRMDEARIENIDWGQILFQEKAAAKVKSREEREDLFGQAEEICRHMRKVAENQGLFEVAGTFFHKEMSMRRFQMRRYSFSRIISKAVDIFSGYGEKPLRIILFSLFMILMFAIGFALGGIHYNDEVIQLSTSQTIVENLQDFWSSIYFSVVTFTTLGYGDIVPQGAVRILSALEAFIGSFTLALFVVVFVKKMTR